MRGGGGGCWACFRSGPISVGGGGGSKRSAPLFPGPQEEPAHGLHPRFVVAEIWADRVDGGGRGRWVSRSTTGVPRGGSLGTPTYIPQNDPHDALIILNIHKWGENFFQKKFAHWLRLPSAKVRPGGRVTCQKVFCVFQTFLNSPSILSIDTSGGKKNPPRKGKKKFGTNPFPQNLKMEKDGFKNFGGV